MGLTAKAAATPTVAEILVRQPLPYSGRDAPDLPTLSGNVRFQAIHQRVVGVHNAVLIHAVLRMESK